MKSNKIEFIGNGDPHFEGSTHFKGQRSDYTLCGLTMDGDVMTTGDYKATNKKVNCSSCQEIVDYCKSIKKTW
tara:strand:- start:207 stop:425 length:219 start_codon:yes stop_codon:yes gene_type:complete